jgi:hypothetical protein
MLPEKKGDTIQNWIFCPHCGFKNRLEKMSCFNCDTPLPKKRLIDRFVRYGPLGPLILAGITLITLLVSIYSFNAIYDRVSPGEIVTLNPPSGYVIIRGFDNFPSDHIIVPVDWRNSWRQKPEIIRSPYLMLRNSTNTYKFYFMGELPEFSRKYFSGNHSEELSRSSTFTIQPSSPSTHALVFQIDHYWDNSSPNYWFRFNPRDTFYASIGFERWNGSHFEHVHENAYFATPIRGYVGSLLDESGNNWDYYAFNSSTGELL